MLLFLELVPVPIDSKPIDSLMLIVFILGQSKVDLFVLSKHLLLLLWLRLVDLEVLLDRNLRFEVTRVVDHRLLGTNIKETVLLGCEHLFLPY
jgi:hypothetical protein